MSSFLRNFARKIRINLNKEMKKKSFLALATLLSSNVMAQINDPVIMTINGKNITRSEFEYSYNKNNSEGVLDKKDVKEYVPLFVDFKLKVAAAQDAKIDTISSIKKELQGYKEQMVLPTIVDTAFIEREARDIYINTAKRFGDDDLLTASHILVLLRQDASEADAAKAKQRIDSIYNVLKGGADFATVAKACSEDKGSAQRGGSLGQFAKGMMIPDFEKAAYALKAGEMSEPIKSTVGWHIIKMEDRHKFESFEFHHDNIIKFLEQRGVKEASANNYIDSIAKQKNVSRDVVIDELCAKLLAKDSDMKNLSQEYYDGTLMYEICKNEVWDKAKKDEAGLETFFNRNKKNYVWDTPRFCGIIIHAKDDATLEAAKKALKGVPENDWAKTLTSTFNNDSVKLVRVERGVYKQGDNANVDNLQFKTGELKPTKGFEATGIFGKIAKKPRTYKDVRGQVITDYQTMLEVEWVETLRKKYKVEINEDVVNTVNAH